MKPGDEVQISHEGDKDDRLCGTILEVQNGRVLVQFSDGSGGWYEEEELEIAV